MDDTTDPNVLINATDSVIESWNITWQPGDLTLGPHPGSSGSVGTGVRWTAPADGDYSIDASFILAQLDDSQPVYIYHNDVQLLAGETGGPNGSSNDYSNASVSMLAGDTIDFIGGVGQGRTIKLEATISDSTGPATPGDANLDGYVNVTDLGILATNYGITSGMGWGEGDFTDDGAVNVNDLGILATWYGTVPGSQAVPEPSTIMLVLLGVLGLAATARRGKRS